MTSAHTVGAPIVTAFDTVSLSASMPVSAKSKGLIRLLCQASGDYQRSDPMGLFVKSMT
jgi:hypothetical protein